MKLFSRRPSLPVIALSALFAGMASSAYGFTWPWAKSEPKDKAIESSLRKFDALERQLAAQYNDSPEIIAIAREAKANFQRQANDYLPDKPYLKGESEVMRKLVAIAITQVEKQAELQSEASVSNMSAEEYQAKADANELVARAAMVEVVTTAGYAPAPPPAVPVEAPSGLQLAPRVEPFAGPANHLTTGLGFTPGVRGQWNGAWHEGDEAARLEWERRVGENSPIVILGVHSTGCAMKPAECPTLPPVPVPEPPVDPAPVDPVNPDPVNPAPVSPAPVSPAPVNPDPVKPGIPSPPTGNPGRPAWTGPTNESILNQISKTIVTTGGTSLLTRQSVSALQRGDYGRASSLAQTALSFDPANRSALEVLQAAKGRGAATGTADAGAAALGRSEPGRFAAGRYAASPSAGIAAAAAAGAARVAAGHAREGAMSAMKLGDAEGALSILTKALGADPNNPALLNLRAQTYGRLGRWEEAYKDASTGLALVPGNMALLTTKSLTENRTRRWRDALATSERMVAADPRGPWGYANRAHAWAGLGNRDAMLSDINRAAALDPRFRQAAADAALLQLPADGDVLFLFPGEAAKGAAKAPVPAGRGRSFSVVVGAGIVGGLLLALGLLSTVLAPLKETVVSVFTRAKRIGPAANTAVATAEPASVAGNVGGLIRGQYEISRQIGAGGMGMVYEGTDRSLGRRVAIKKMREELRVNARERERFVIEAKTVASLHHPNIVDIYAIAEESSDVYLVFEYVDGKTVHDLVQGAGRLAPAEAVRVTRAMGEALTYAHAHGVIHRDMKPSNVMVTSAGQVKVMDFGIARMAKDALTRYSMTNTVVGTPPYMAPEQEQGVVRKESDVYSLAICSYEMLTGKMPFIGIGAGMLMNKINMSYIPPSRAIAGLPEALDEVFLKAFQADPERRYRAPLEFVTALAAAAGGARKTA